MWQQSRVFSAYTAMIHRQEQGEAYGFQAPVKAAMSMSYNMMIACGDLGMSVVNTVKRLNIACTESSAHAI